VRGTCLTASLVFVWRLRKHVTCLEFAEASRPDRDHLYVDVWLVAEVVRERAAPVPNRDTRASPFEKECEPALFVCTTLWAERSKPALDPLRRPRKRAVNQRSLDLNGTRNIPTSENLVDARNRDRRGASEASEEQGGIEQHRETDEADGDGPCRRLG
jgi:hypothetical protein